MAAPLRILINAIHAHSGGGITYLRHLLPELAGDAGLDIHVCFHADQEGRLPLPANGVTPHALRFANGFVGRLVWEQVGLPAFARRLAADVVFSPANFGPLSGPPGVILLRNALAVGDSERRAMKRLYWWVLGIMTRLSIRRSTRVLAVSAYARDALTQGMAARFRDKVAVVHHGRSADFSPPPAGTARDGFLLCVGDLYIQKNLHGLLPAIAELRRQVPGIRLKIAGRPVDARYAEGVYEQARRLGLQDHVEWLGHVGTAELVDLYRRCRLFVFPSLAETFGNPLVEAMACGAPVACSDTTAMPEVAGDAAVYFDPHDTAAMADCIGMALSDDGLLAGLSERALRRAAAFSWTETARRTADVLKRA